MIQVPRPNSPEDMCLYAFSSFVRGTLCRLWGLWLREEALIGNCPRHHLEVFMATVEENMCESEEHSEPEMEHAVEFLQGLFDEIESESGACFSACDEACTGLKTGRIPSSGCSARRRWR